MIELMFETKNVVVIKGNLMNVNKLPIYLFFIYNCSVTMALFITVSTMSF